MSGLPGRKRGDKPPGRKPSRPVYFPVEEGSGVDQPSYIRKTYVGYCKDCKWWEKIPAFGCPIVIITEEADDRHLTPPDFGCVRWEAKDE